MYTRLFFLTKKEVFGKRQYTYRFRSTISLEHLQGRRCHSITRSPAGQIHQLHRVPTPRGLTVEGPPVPVLVLQGELGAPLPGRFIPKLNQAFLAKRVAAR